MGDRAVIFVPEDGGRFARRYTRECQEHCDREHQEIMAVTANPSDVWVMMDQRRADLVVVARDAHLRWLVRDKFQVAKRNRSTAESTRSGRNRHHNG